MLPTQIDSSKRIVGSPANEFLFIVFYYDEAELVAVIKQSNKFRGYKT